MYSKLQDVDYTELGKFWVTGHVTTYFIEFDASGYYSKHPLWGLCDWIVWFAWFLSVITNHGHSRTFSSWGPEMGPLTLLSDTQSDPSGGLWHYWERCLIMIWMHALCVNYVLITDMVLCVRMAVDCRLHKCLWWHTQGSNCLFRFHLSHFNYAMIKSRRLSLSLFLSLEIGNLLPVQRRCCRNWLKIGWVVCLWWIVWKELTCWLMQQRCMKLEEITILMEFKWGSH